MLAETRRRLLLDLVHRQGFASLDELVKALGVSESTVRRDLEMLDLAGTIKRTHGGAVYPGEVRALPAFEDRVCDRDGREAGDRPGRSRPAGGRRHRPARRRHDDARGRTGPARAALQVVTNSLPIAQLLAASQPIDLILIGGYVYPRTGVALGPLAIATMQGIRVRKAILGAGGIVAERHLQLQPAPGRDRAADDGAAARK